MKILGLLGGTSWPSTMLYYEQLNRLVSARLGGFHCARILLYSIDYHNIKSSYGTDWKRIEDELKKELEFFTSQKPDCILICNNTLHKAFDAIGGRLNLKVPIFHAGILSALEAESKNYKSVLLLGTRFTMEDGFFAKYFEDKNITVKIPEPEDRIKIQNIQTQISLGVKKDAFFDDFELILSNYKNIDAVCLACTELPLYISRKNCFLPIINPSDLQCIEAVKFAIN
jgi:aspartate racemase